MTKLEIQEQILALREQCDALGQEKLDLQRQLGAIRLRCQTRIPTNEYARCIQDRKRLNDDMMDVEQKLLPLKAKIRSLANESMRANLNGATPYSLVTQLVALRTEYEEFSTDRSRVESMRVMAAQFCQKLNKIIRHACNSDV